jgi:DNA polymerase-1
MPRINSKGFNTSAILGFVNTLEEVLKKENPTHIGVAFDPPGPTFRHEAYEQYKAQREKTPEVIRASVPIIKEIIRAYRIPILEVPNYEADDVIGTIAKKASADYEVYMMTPDKDYGQLVGRNIFMYRPKYGSAHFEIFGVEEVKKKYGLENPLQMIDFLGLTGDKSDNIPGCPGVGEVTAKKLIAQFGSIENLLANTGKLQGSLKTNIEKNREMIVFSKFLATIKTDVPIEFNPDELLREKIDEPALRKIFDGLEFRHLSARVFGEAKKQIAVRNQPIQASLFDNPTATGFNPIPKIAESFNLWTHLDTPEAILDYIKKIKIQKSVTFDMETTGNDPLTAELTGMSLALQDEETSFVPFPANREEAQKRVDLFWEILESPDILKIGQNLKFAINALKKYSVRVNSPMFDTSIAHYLLNSDHQNPKANHAAAILKQKTVFENLIEENNFSELFYDVEMPLVKVLADMEEAGVRLDVAALKQSSEELNKYLRKIETIVYELSGLEFNINSPKMVGEVLFDQLKISNKAGKTKSGQYTTGEEVLENLKSKHPVVEKILEYRKVKKLLSTYIDALPNLLSPVDGKIHTTYNQTATSTGRLSSTNPNLQNIPIRDEEGKEIRKAFIPDDGCLFLSADYSQIELRIMAHLSEDPGMIEAFLSGQDIHAATAAKIFGLPIDRVSRDMRRKAKTANFGIIYGISAFGLSEQLHIPRTEAKELIDGYFATYPGVKTYMDRSIETARRTGYVKTIFHRKRLLPDINSQNAVVRGYAERFAINAPIQGSAADIIKVAMNRIHRRFREERLRSQMIMQVHDELNFNVAVDEADVARRIVIDEMQNAAQLKVQLIADCGTGKNWLEAH